MKRAPGGGGGRSNDTAAAPLLSNSLNSAPDGTLGTRRLGSQASAGALAWILAVATVLVNVGGTLLGLGLLGDQYMVFDPVAGEANVLTPQAAAGVVIYLAAIATGGLVAGLALVHMLMGPAQDARRRGAVVAILMGAGFIAMTVAAWVKLVQPGDTFANTNTQDALKQFLGGLAICMYTPLSVAYVLAGLLVFVRGQKEAQPPAGVPPVQPDGAARNMPRVVGLLALLGAVWFLTSILTCMWNYQASSYFAATSTYAINGNTAISFGSAAGPNFAPPVIVVKLYEDAVVYFSVLSGLVLLGTLATYVAGVRRVLHRRVRVPLPAYFNTWKTGATVGELLLTTVVCGLYGFWYWYWNTGYTRIRDEAEAWNDPYATMQVQARVMGHMTTLTMSFLTFPITRNSVWEAAFGVPFDRAVKFHRLLGRLTWTLVTVHMLVWQVKWLKEGTLLRNIVTISDLTITDTGVDGAIHYDNFTVVIAELGWLVLTLVLVAANFLRRYSYRTFHWTHHAVWLFMLAALIHAWSHWYYVAAGLVLYLLDKLTRAVRSTRPAQIVSLTYSAAAGVTRLEVDAGCLGAAPHAAGQYAFVYMPAAGALEWHPVTISSPPALPVDDPSPTADSTVTFHVKNMGAGTWSNELACTAAALQDAGNGGTGKLSSVALSIDGPYGRSGHYYERGTLLLVAGGIGITPLQSIALDLLRRSAAGALPSAVRVRTVHLVWSVRDMQLLATFADTLAQLATFKTNGGDIAFHLHVYNTGAGNAIDSAASTPAELGWCTPQNQAWACSIAKSHRPDLPKLFTHVAMEAAATTGTQSLFDVVTVMVCGPEAMIAASSDLAFEHGMDFHSEIFHF